MSVLSGVLATKLPVFAPQRGAARLEWSEFVLRDICIVVAMALAPFCMLHFLRGNIVLALLNTACLAMLAATICRLHFRSATALDGSMIIALGGITVLASIFYNGMVGLLWSYCVCVGAFVLMERKLAALFNVFFVLLLVPISAITLDWIIGLRVFFTLSLVSGLAYIFCYL